MEHDIFISYSRKDLQIVDQFVNKITEAGYTVWIDRNGIYSGDEFTTQIVRAIRECSIVLFFSSKYSNASDWTVREISYSIRKEKTIIPIRLDDCEYHDSIDFTLINIDYIQYHNSQFEQTLERLMNSIAAHIGPRISTEAKTAEESFKLAMHFYETGELDKAYSCCKSAAEKGYADAQFYLGVCYSIGRGVTENDQEAIKWFKKAAEQDHVDAQYNLGFYYQHGHAVNQDYKEAIKWFQGSDEQNNDQRYEYSSLGFCRQGKPSITIDYQEAVKWYQKAARHGHTKAIQKLGECFENGYGVSKDVNQAMKCYVLSLKNGNHDAIKDIDRLKELSHGQYN